MPRPILALILGLAAASAKAEPPAQPHYELIKWPEVEVRSGPTGKNPVTMILRRNARVYVKKPVNLEGFVEILPPPGSISWIPHAVVTKLGQPENGKQAFSVTGNATDGPVPVTP